MAKCKFKASQFYKVKKDGMEINFNYFGEYETDKKEELEVLHSLIGAYVKEIQCSVLQKENQEELKEPKEIAPKQEKKSEDKKPSHKKKNSDK